MTSSSNTRDTASNAQQAKIVVAAVDEFAGKLHRALSLAAPHQLDGRNGSSPTSGPATP